jgi:hypothetical protein
VRTLYQCSFASFLDNGSPTPGPPVYVMQFAATFFTWVYTAKMTQLCGRLGTSLAVVCQVRPGNYPAESTQHNNVFVLCNKIVGDLRLRRAIALNIVKSLRFSMENELTWYATGYNICRSLSDGVPCQNLGHRSTYFSGLPLQHRCK